MKNLKLRYVWIIMQNDYPRTVVTESRELAEKVKKRLELEYYQEYRESCYWHINSCLVTEK